MSIHLRSVDNCNNAKGKATAQGRDDRFDKVVLDMDWCRRSPNVSLALSSISETCLWGGFGEAGNADDGNPIARTDLDHDGLIRDPTLSRPLIQQVHIGGAKSCPIGTNNVILQPSSKPKRLRRILPIDGEAGALYPSLWTSHVSKF